MQPSHRQNQSWILNFDRLDFPFCTHKDDISHRVKVFVRKRVCYNAYFVGNINVTVHFTRVAKLSFVSDNIAEIRALGDDFLPNALACFNGCREAYAAVKLRHFELSTLGIVGVIGNRRRVNRLFKRDCRVNLCERARNSCFNEVLLLIEVNIELIETGNLLVSADSTLAFESRPFVAVKDEQIGKALTVELKGKTAGQSCFENINQPVLKTAFET